MSVFRNIKIELIILIIITLNVFISFNLDLGLYNFFQNFNNNLNNIYLKEFFIDITELGNSVWYFGICVLCPLILYINKKINIFKLDQTNKLIKFFLSFFIYIFIVGLVTQIIKHLVGRPRPNHTNFDESFGFNFLTFDSSFHSFPSGHSSTIFIVCFVLTAVIPRLRIFFYFFASLIALSRVVVGAHFLTDVIAGGLLALIVFKILNNIINKNYKDYSFVEFIFYQNSRLYYFIVILLLGALFVTIGSSFDLYFSGLFYYGNSQFYLQSYDFLSKVFRDVLLPLILIYILILPIIGQFIKIDRIYLNYKFSVKEIFLIWSTQIFSMIIFINLILKNLWGRARPGDVLQLGGKETFTSWFEYSNACSTNCSFVSGDASVGFSIIILYFITKKVIFINLSIIFGLLLGIIRIIAGGHFLSDIIFAGLIVILINFFIYKLYKRYYGH